MPFSSSVRLGHQLGLSSSVVLLCSVNKVFLLSYFWVKDIINILTSSLGNGLIFVKNLSIFMQIFIILKRMFNLI